MGGFSGITSFGCNGDLLAHDANAESPANRSIRSLGICPLGSKEKVNEFHRLLQGMSQSKFDRIFALIAIIAVAIGIVAGFWVLGTPNRQRLIAADRERIQDLRSIVWRLYEAAEKAQDRGQPIELPESLEGRDRPTDPITNLAYEYRRLSETTYELCAEFATDSNTYLLGQTRRNEPENDWRHPQGRHCFEFDVAKDALPVFR